MAKVVTIPVNSNIDARGQTLRRPGASSTQASILFLFHLECNRFTPRSHA
jgi:hypothetical protein